MPHSDLSLEELATYLHVTPAQVQKLVNQGRLPARRVGGEWRFAQADVHHWLEERIGLSAEAELAQMEGLLEKKIALHEEPPTLVEMLPREAIALPLEARTRNSVITKMVELAAGTGLLWDADKMLEAVQARENLHPTALDNGVALLHPRRPLGAILGQPFLALGRTPQGIPFGGKMLTDVYFLICSQDDRGHLRTLARLSRLIGLPDFLPGLREATGPTDALDCVRACEAKLT